MGKLFFFSNEIFNNDLRNLLFYRERRLFCLFSLTKLEFMNGQTKYRPTLTKLCKVQPQPDLR